MRAHNVPDVNQDEPFEPDIICISNREWLALFERHVNEVLGIDAAEFVRRYRAGEYEEYDPEITLLSTSVPFYELLHTA